MSEDVDWPGRGGTWLGVPAVVAVLIGLALFTTSHDRQQLSRELLRGGGAAVASSVQVEVVGRRGALIERLQVGYTTGDGRQLQVNVSDYDSDSQDMAEGVHPPAAGTRYAAPLRVVYRQSDPSVVLATVDAEKWAADANTPRYGFALLVVGAGGVVWAPVMLSQSARRRGLPWWKWYAAGTRNSP
ncbi:hypothetical protein ACIA49_21035 [Kribbella sp. NPDC051587]|uniref:hypothetical protein n=1 Tax=Kribbella sp. NPDC051587 TaxID=3364119 RepID=UPI0037BBC08F